LPKDVITGALFTAIAGDLKASALKWHQPGFYFSFFLFADCYIRYSLEPAFPASSLQLIKPPKHYINFTQQRTRLPLQREPTTAQWCLPYPVSPDANLGTLSGRVACTLKKVSPNGRLLLQTSATVKQSDSPVNLNW
jgi:hypothetical protein